MVHPDRSPEWDAAVARQVALANEAVAAVLHDLHRATSLQPTVAVEVWMASGVCISIDGGYTAPSMWAVEMPQAFAEVADYFQEQLDQSGAGAWPVCNEHEVGCTPKFATQRQYGNAGSAGTQSPRSVTSRAIAERPSRMPRRSRDDTCVISRFVRAVVSDERPT